MACAAQRTSASRRPARDRRAPPPGRDRAQVRVTDEGISPDFRRRRDWPGAHRTGTAQRGASEGAAAECRQKARTPSRMLRCHPGRTRRRTANSTANIAATTGQREEVGEDRPRGEAARRSRGRWRARRSPRKKIDPRERHPPRVAVHLRGQRAVDQAGEARAQGLAARGEGAAEHGAQQQVGAHVLEEEDAGKVVLEDVPSGPEQAGEHGDGGGDEQAVPGAAGEDRHEDGKRRQREQGAERGRVADRDRVVGERGAGERHQDERDDERARARRPGHFVLRSATVAASASRATGRCAAFSWSSSRSLKP